MAKERAAKNHPELSPEEIGVCFISPCPAKASYTKNGFGDYKSYVDEVVPISDVYFLLISKMKKDSPIEISSEAGRIGIGWASAGGEATAIFNDGYLAADGIDHVIDILDQIENGTIAPLDFIELNACTGGCVGGVLTIQNPFIARAKLRNLRRYMPVCYNTLSEEEKQYIPESFLFEELPEYAPITRLGDTLAESMRMMADIQKLRKELPGIDCGACGAPTCRAFAEDVIKRSATADDCPIKAFCQGKKKGS